MHRLTTKLPQEKTKPARRPGRGKPWLKGVTAAVLVAAASGMLLFLPPLSLWPLYPVTLVLHAWLGILVAVPFLLVLVLHGGRRRRPAAPRGWTWSGIGFGLSFLTVLATGIARMAQPQLPVGWLILHMVTGALTILFGLWHGARMRLDR